VSISNFDDYTIFESQEATVSRPATTDLSPEDTEDLSPLPRGKPTRRGGVSAEPVSEEDATSYVKKVRLSCLACE